MYLRFHGEFFCAFSSRKWSLFCQDTLFCFYKNIFYKNIEAEICEILRIF